MAKRNRGLYAFAFALILIVCLSQLPPFKQNKLGPAVKCKHHLQHLASISLLYAEDHNGVFCDNLEQLTPYVRDQDHANPFTCPLTGVKYQLVPGQTIDMPYDSVLVHCPSEHLKPSQNFPGNAGAGKTGYNIAFIDCHIKTVDLSKREKIFSEQGIEHKALDR